MRSIIYIKNKSQLFSWQINIKVYIVYTLIFNEPYYERLKWENNFLSIWL